MPLQRRAENGENGNEGTEDKVLYFFQHTGRSMVSQCVAIIASQPFQGLLHCLLRVNFSLQCQIPLVFLDLNLHYFTLVITVRMVAQFVGGEKTYK